MIRSAVCCILGLATSLAFCATAAAQDKPATLARVSGQRIHEGHLNLIMLRRGIASDSAAMMRKPMIDLLIERRLIAEFLDKSRVKVDAAKLTNQFARTRQLIERGGRSLKEFLEQNDLNRDELRAEANLNLAWDAYRQRRITPEKVREAFRRDRIRYDGTRLRGSQIMLKVSGDDDSAFESAETKLKAIRRQIESGDLTFAQAAAENSQAGSAQAGGDVGWLTWSSGRMPREFCRQLFQLKDGDISQPFRTQFGVHICTVAERKPGDLSLEDARAEILAEMSTELWTSIVDAQRRKTRVERMD